MVINKIISYFSCKASTTVAYTRRSEDVPRMSRRMSVDTNHFLNRSPVGLQGAGSPQQPEMHIEDARRLASQSLQHGLRSSSSSPLTFTPRLKSEIIWEARRLLFKPRSERGQNKLQEILDYMVANGPSEDEFSSFALKRPEDAWNVNPKKSYLPDDGDVLYWGKLLPGEVHHEGRMKRRVLRNDNNIMLCTFATDFRPFEKHPKPGHKFALLPDGIMVFATAHKSNPSNSRIFNIDWDLYARLHY